MALVVGSWYLCGGLAREGGGRQFVKRLSGTFAASLSQSRGRKRLVVARIPEKILSPSFIPPFPTQPSPTLLKGPLCTLSLSNIPPALLSLV